MLGASRKAVSSTSSEAGNDGIPNLKAFTPSWPRMSCKTVMKDTSHHRLTYWMTVKAQADGKSLLVGTPPGPKRMS